MQNRVYTYNSSNISFAVLSPHSLLHDARVTLKACRVYPLSDWVKQLIVEYFVKYLEVSRTRVIVLEDEDGFYCTLPYRTRFHDVRGVIERFNEVFSRASRRYRVGVWVTLTTDPSAYANYDYLRYRYEIVKALNRFFAWLRKRFKKVSYINVIEFTDSGLIHFHIVVFGLKRIEDYRVFTRRLIGWGFGKINFMYQIVNENGVWKPRKIINIDNCDGGGVSKDFILASRMGLGNYLKKYLTKTLKAVKAVHGILNSPSGSLDSILGVFQTKSNNGISQSLGTLSKNGVVGSATSSNIANLAAALWKLAMYWALRLRFFTYSRDLWARKRVKLMRYHFVGVFSVERYVVVNGFWIDWLENPTFLCFDVVSITEALF
jgi:hypothetical protein